eukprot:403376151
MGCCQSIKESNQPRPLRPNMTQRPINKNSQQGDGQAELGPNFQGGAAGSQKQNGVNNPQNRVIRIDQRNQNNKNNNIRQPEDIEIVMVDANNIPPPSARSSVKGSFYSNMGDFSHIILPVILKTYQEILQSIVKGDTQKVKELIQENNFTEIVSIRGLNMTIEDIEFENGQVETQMWNPLHFAIYYQNLDLVKYFLKEMKINVPITGMKSNADHEKEAVNNDRYPEDKLMALLLAYDRRNSQILKFLLDEGFKIWPNKCINMLLNEKLFADIREWHENTNRDSVNYNDILNMWQMIVQVIMRSKTAHAFYGSLSIKKRKEWIYEFSHNVEQLPEPIQQAFYQELSLQPYCGFFLFFLLFEDKSENEALAQSALAQANDFDYISFLISEKIEDPEEYYDINRTYKLKDKLTPEVGQILTRVISNLKKLAVELNPKEFIKTSNTQLLEIAKNSKSNSGEYQAFIEQLKEYSYLAQLQIMQVKGLEEQQIMKKNVSIQDDLQRQLKEQMGTEYQDEMCSTQKWNPVTFALYNCNLELLKYLLKTSVCNQKKLLKIPGSPNTQYINRIFPLFMAIQRNHQGMFKYFWNDLSYLWDEDTFENVFRLIVKKDLSEYVQMIFNSETLQTIFASMSYQYKFSFIQHILTSKKEFLDEINQQIMQEQENGDGEAEEYLINKKMSLDHFYMKVYEELTKQPYSLHFYLSFSKELIKSGEEIYQDMNECLEILRKAQKQVRDQDVQVFLHINPDVAVQIVNDLIDEQTSSLNQGGAYHNSFSNAIDKETKILAQRIKKCPNYRQYKLTVQAMSSQVISNNKYQ